MVKRTDCVGKDTHQGISWCVYVAVESPAKAKGICWLFSHPDRLSTCLFGSHSCSFQDGLRLHNYLWDLISETESIFGIWPSSNPVPRFSVMHLEIRFLAELSVLELWTTAPSMPPSMTACFWLATPRSSWNSACGCCCAGRKAVFCGLYMYICIKKKGKWALLCAPFGTGFPSVLIISSPSVLCYWPS